MVRNFILLLLAVVCCPFLLNAQYQLKQDLSLKYIIQEPKIKTNKTKVLVLLHGYGSNEQDLIGLKEGLPQDIRIISCRATYPLAPDTYQWFEREMVNGKYAGKEAHIDSSRKLILKFLSQIQAKYKCKASDIYLCGFSQGAIMALAVGLYSPNSVRGIGVLSGRLPESVKRDVQSKEDLKKLSVFIAHGTKDDRLGYDEAIAADKYLRAIGLKPSFKTYEGMGHSISAQEVKDLTAWLNMPQ